MKAVGILQAACPNDLPATPTGRLAAMHVRVAAMLQAVQAVRPALEKLYASLSDEQKERFNALDENAFGTAPQPDVAQLCGNKRSSPTKLPLARIEQSLRLSSAQDANLKALDDASAKSSEILSANCPTGQALTPPGRVAAMEQRLSGMLQAIEAVRPALTNFYGSLSDEQKARFDRLGLASPPDRQAGSASRDFVHGLNRPRAGLFRQSRQVPPLQPRRLTISGCAAEISATQNAIQPSTRPRSIRGR